MANALGGALAGFVWALVMIPPLAAGQDIKEQLLAAPDDASAARILDANPQSIDQALYEACTKAGQAHYDHHENAEAAHDFKISVEVASRLHSDELSARAFRSLGMALRRSDQPGQALAAYEQGLPLAEKAGDKSTQAELLRGIGVAHRALGEFSQAIDADEKSVALFRELNNTHELGASLNNLALGYDRIGDLSRGAEILEEAAKICRNDPAIFISAIDNLGTIAAALGNNDAALSWFTQSAQFKERVENWLGLVGDLNNIGLIHAGEKEFEKALAAYNRALALAIKVRDLRLQSITLLNRAGLYNRRHQLDLAIKDLEESVRINSTIEAKEARLAAISALAATELEAGQIEAGCARAQEAVSLANEFQEPGLTWQAFDVFGRCSLKKHDTANARDYFVKAIDRIELVRSHAGGSELEGADLLDAKIAPYQELLELDLLENKIESAFEDAERAKARQLLDVIRGGRTVPNQSMAAGEIAEEKRLNERLAELEKQAGASSDSRGRAKLRAQEDDTRRQLEQHRIQLYAAHPEMAAQRENAPPMSLTQCADLLPDSETALVEFISTQEKLYALTIRRSGRSQPTIRVHAISVSKEELANEVDGWTGQLGARDLGYQRAGRKLYEQLIAPLAAGLRSAKLLVIVPDGPLWNLPFQALIDGNGHHLIESYAVFYAPSLTYLRETRLAHSVRPPASHQLLAIGDPESADLPDAARQLNTIAEIYGSANSKVLTGVNATKAVWRQQAPQYRILHIATHGILNERNPLYSYLLFSGSTNSERTFEARELLNMNIHPDLVVLSACETGRGRIAEGEGLVGMSWAFLLAGAPTAVVSQWKTDSAGTADLMIAMHAEFKKAVSPSHAFGRARGLQAAELALMQRPEYRHPFYWAGFVMVGDGY